MLSLQPPLEDRGLRVTFLFKKPPRVPGTVGRGLAPAHSAPLGSLSLGARVPAQPGLRSCQPGDCCPLAAGKRNGDWAGSHQSDYVSPVLSYLRPGSGGTWGGAPAHVTPSVCLSPRHLSPWCPHPTLWKQRCRSHWGLGTL